MYRRVLQELSTATSKIAGMSEGHVVGKVGTAKLGNTLKALAEAREVLRTGSQKRSPEVLEVRASIDFVYNHASSLRDALLARDASSEDILKFRKTSLIKLQSAVNQLNEIPLAKTKVDEESADWVKTLATVKHSVPVESSAADLDKAMDEAKGIISRNKSFKRRLPSTTDSTKKFVLVEMPIIPLFSTVITADEMHKAGFDAESIGFYHVLADQRVLGLNTALIKKEGIDDEHLIELVLESLRHRTNKKWSLASDHASGHKTSGYTYYWIMPDRELNALLGAGKGKAYVTEWGFAFN